MPLASMSLMFMVLEVWWQKEEELTLLLWTVLGKVLGSELFCLKAPKMSFSLVPENQTMTSCPVQCDFNQISCFLLDIWRECCLNSEVINELWFTRLASPLRARSSLCENLSLPYFSQTQHRASYTQEVTTLQHTPYTGTRLKLCFFETQVFAGFQRDNELINRTFQSFSTSRRASPTRRTIKLDIKSSKAMDFSVCAGALVGSLPDPSLIANTRAVSAVIYHGALVVITLHPTSWPRWLARAECSRCHGLPAGTDSLLYLLHTPCPTSNENTSEVKASSTLPRLPLRSAEWEDLIECYPRESRDNLPGLTCFSPPCLPWPWAHK